MDHKNQLELKSIINKVGQLVNTRNFKPALEYAYLWQVREPQSPNAHYWVSWLQSVLKLYPQALQTIQSIVDKGARQPPLLIQLAKCYLENNQQSKAATTVKDIRLEDVSNNKDLYSLGAILAAVGEHKNTLAVYTKITSISPDDAAAQYQKGVAENHCHLVDSAKETFNKVIRLNPAFFRAYLMLSQLNKQTVSNNNINAWQKVLSHNHHIEDANVLLNLALFKENEDIENYNHAFKHLKTANDLINKSSCYKPEADKALTSSIISTFNSEFVSNNTNHCNSEEPIFIIGMPRTGTTLVEKILTTSDDIYSAGELNNFTVEMSKLTGKINTNQNLAHILKDINAINFQILGENYINSTRPQTGKTKYFVDKMPFNYQSVGAIVMAIPNAKIISLTRNPVDTCFSNYKQLFATSVQMASYDLNNIATQYACYVDLMNHWKRLFNNQIYEVNYESLVTNQHVESMKLVEYCQLGWNKKFLTFYENAEPSATASVSQIRQPIHQKSLNKWKYYTKELSTLLESLAMNGIIVKDD